MAKKSQYTKEKLERNISEDAFDEELESFLKKMELDEDTTCGFWKFKGGMLQKFANKKVFIVIYGLCGLLFSATFAYFNGTISTMEKRFKVSSQTMGYILVGNDITQLFVSIFMSYYAGKGHRPRWIAFGMYCITAFCFLCTIPHLLYGPGEDSLMLTEEYGSKRNTVYNNLPDESVNRSNEFQSGNSLLCNVYNHTESCEESVQEGNVVPITIWFVAQLISGIGGALYYSLGYSYMDDNIKKSKSPGVISLTYFIRTIGPTVGYVLSSIFLKLYIAPTLTPTIDNSDPRWIGSWWMGWFIMGGVSLVLSTMLLMFPRELPRAAARRELIRQKSMEPKTDPEKPSFKDMLTTMKRLLNNTIFVFNQFSIIFFVFGYIPYWIYLPKYIEMQFRKSASSSSLVTGSVGLIFSALGILAGGIIIQKYKPKAKYLGFINVCVTIITLIGLFEYSILGCKDVDRNTVIVSNESNMSCNAACNCDQVKFSPVCSVLTQESFISPCHAGCRQENKDDSGSTIFTDCSCVPLFLDDASSNETSGEPVFGGSVISGLCNVECAFYYYTFLATVCVLKFVGALSKTTTFLLSVRCVEERDKTLSLGLGLAVISIFSLIPAPIFFGYLMDTTCIIWGTSCGKRGNCWLYDATMLRQRLNYVAMSFMTVALVFDVLIWLKVPDLNLYGEVEENILKGFAQPDQNNSEEIKTKNKSVDEEKS